MSSSARAHPNKQQHKPPNKGTEAALLDRLWDSRSEDWSKEDQRLWESFLEKLHESGLEDFVERTSKPKARGRQLFRRSWVTVIPETGEFHYWGENTELPERAVPVLLMQRDGDFRIHPRVETLCRLHPWIVAASPKCHFLGDRRYFLNQLEKLRLVEEMEGFDEDGFINHVQLAQGPLRRASECSVELLYLNLFLDPEQRHPLEGDEPLDWLAGAKDGERLWLLLNAAFRAGRALEGYHIFRDPAVGDALDKRILQPQGRKTSLAGEAIEELILRFEEENPDTEPNPLPVLKWLKGRVGDEDQPPIVDHPLWTLPLQKLSWKKFKSRFRSAKIRMEKKRLRIQPG